MVGIFKGVSRTFAFLCALATFVVGYCIKISPLLGSYCSFFSVADALAPLAGLGGIGMACCIACVRGSITFWALEAPFKAIVYHFPSFSASLAWAYPVVVLRVIVPLICMVAFSIHPIGRYAIPYTFYWLIPVGIYFSGRKTIFLQALATTFIAHAVGSVVWLYLKALPVALWWELIPVVAAERLCYAAVMTVVYCLIMALVGKKHRRAHKNYSSKIF